jgi:hypothetical protein
MPAVRELIPIKSGAFRAPVSHAPPVCAKLFVLTRFFTRTGRRRTKPAMAGEGRYHFA